MWELDCEESWVLKNDAFELWCWRRLFESPLDCQEIQLVHSKGDQSWVFFGRTDAKAETPVLWPPHAKSWLIGKDSDAGRDWGQEEKETTEDEMAGMHHRLYGHEFCVNSGIWGWTGRPGVLQFMGSQRVGHDWVTELNWHYLDGWLGKQEVWGRVWGEKEGKKASMRHVTETTVVISGLILIRTFWESYGILVRTLYLRIDHDKLLFFLHWELLLVC